MMQFATNRVKLRWNPEDLMVEALVECEVEEDNFWHPLDQEDAMAVLLSVVPMVGDDLLECDVVLHSFTKTKVELPEEAEE